MKNLTTEEIREELRKQGLLDYLEDLTLSITPEDWCYECSTHKHICGHEKAIILFVGGSEGATTQFLNNLSKNKEKGGKY